MNYSRATDDYCRIMRVVSRDIFKRISIT